MMTWEEWIREWDLERLFGMDDKTGDSNDSPRLPTLAADFRNRKIELTDDDKELAWRFFQQMHTRVVTRKLHFRTGDEKAALDSAYQLFQFARNQIVALGPRCRSVATLVNHVLNGRIERFTSKWHRSLENQEFLDPEKKKTFRLELFKLQEDLLPFKNALESLALGEELETSDGVIEKATRSTRSLSPPAHANRDQDLASAREYRNEENQPWPSTTFEQRKRLLKTLTRDTLKFEFIPSRICDDFEQLEQTEREHLLARRKHLNSDPELPQPIELSDTVGLSFSGGGIRAGTFAMGVTQRLARQGLLSDVDYLSTVSGGGYFGSFLSCYLDTPNERVGLQSNQYPFRFASNDEPNSLRHIRNHASYLTQGAFYQFQIFGVVLYGLLTNLLLVLPLISLAVILTGLILFDAFPDKTSDLPCFYFLDAWQRTGLATAVCGSFLTFVRTMFRGESIGSFGHQVTRLYGWLCGALLAEFLILTLVNLIPYLIYLRHVLPAWTNEYFYSVQSVDESNGLFAVLSAAIVPFILRLLSGLGDSNSIWKRVFRILFVLSGPLFFLFVYVVMVDNFVVEKNYWTQYYGWFDVMLHGWLFAVPLLIGILLMNVNFSSPHLFYRNSLSRTFQLESEPSFEESTDRFNKTDIRKLSELRKHRKELPYHLINCVVNAPASWEPGLRGRNSDFYIFSQAFSGSPLTGYAPTAELEKLDNHLNLATAMAISGAAASPHSGDITDRDSVFLKTLLNIRLGYWMRNLKANSWFRLPFLQRFRHPTAFHLFFEMFGLIWEKFKLFGWTFQPAYHHLSDGGHLENLGIYELLRRRTKIIIAVDGEADPQMRCESMMKLTRFARIDFGIEIHFDPKEFELQESGFAKSHFTLGVIDYGSTDNEVQKANKREFGIIIYLKNNMTGNESSDLLDYRRRNPQFPHVNISDQFFDEEQFEAFRALGYHVADEALSAEIFEGAIPDKLSVKRWAEQLVMKLYPY